jgi:hypothetical protein
MEMPIMTIPAAWPLVDLPLKQGSVMVYVLSISAASSLMSSTWEH